MNSFGFTWNFGKKISFILVHFRGLAFEKWEDIVQNKRRNDMIRYKMRQDKMRGSLLNRFSCVPPVPACLSHVLHHFWCTIDVSWSLACPIFLACRNFWRALIFGGPWFLVCPQGQPFLFKLHGISRWIPKMFMFIWVNVAWHMASCYTHFAGYQDILFHIKDIWKTLNLAWKCKLFSLGRKILKKEIYCCCVVRNFGIRYRKNELVVSFYLESLRVSKSPKRIR